MAVFNSPSTALPSPKDLGFPFADWRDEQRLALEWLATHDARFLAVPLPTGAGKTAIAIARALTHPGRTAILVPDTALQAQIKKDYPGVAVLMGRAHYECLLRKHKEIRPYHGSEENVNPLSCHEVPCQDEGFVCPFKSRRGTDADAELYPRVPVGSTCAYYEAVDRAKESKVVVLSVAAYVAHQHFANGNLGAFQQVIVDEAHQLPDILSALLSVQLGSAQKDSADIDDVENVTHVVERLSIYAERLKPRDTETARKVARKASALRELVKGEHVVSEDPRKDNDTRRVWHYRPVWPGQFADTLVFRDVPTILLLSGTLTTDDLRKLNVDRAEWFDTSSSMPIDRCPIFFSRVVQVNRRLSAEGWQQLVDAVDGVLAAFPNDRVVIHSHSWDKAEQLLEATQHATRFVPKGSSTADTVSRFLRTPGGVLVHPGLTKGFDFPGDACRVQIVLRIPYPNMGDALVKKRQALDPNYLASTALVTLRQASARAMRAPDDWCVTFLFDSALRDVYYSVRNEAPPTFWDRFQHLPTAQDAIRQALVAAEVLR